MFRSTNSLGDSNEALVVIKGHITVYTVSNEALDGGRFLIPLSYLDNSLISDLFAIAEEEFGITGGGPIVLPVDSLSMESIIGLNRRGLASEPDNAFLMSLTRCSSYFTAYKAMTFLQVNECS